MAKVAVLVLSIAALLLAGSPAAAHLIHPTKPAGDSARGQAIFEAVTIRGTPGCGSCHSLRPGVTIVGPSLAGAGAHAEALLHSPGYQGLATTPEELLREAILVRDCGLWGGSRHLVIPEWDGVFERQELLDLAAFLASLKS